MARTANTTRHAKPKERPPLTPEQVASILQMVLKEAQRINMPIQLGRHEDGLAMVIGGLDFKADDLGAAVIVAMPPPEPVPMPETQA